MAGDTRVDIYLKSGASISGVYVTKFLIDETNGKLSEVQSLPRHGRSALYIDPDEVAAIVDHKPVKY